MTRDRLITTTLAALLALPAVAAAPGYFQIPGTETTAKIYGFARLDLAWDGKAATGPLGGLVTARSKVTTTDDKLPSNQIDLTASSSRLGFTTTTPSPYGDVIFKVEGDFSNSAPTSLFRLRHAYGQMGSIIAGQTDTVFLDPSGDTVRDMYIDWQGMAGGYANISSRPVQVRYTVTLNKQASLAFSVEQNKTSAPDASLNTGYSVSKSFPSLVGAFKFGDAWGHVRAAIAYQKYDAWRAEGGTAAVYGWKADPKNPSAAPVWTIITPAVPNTNNELTKTTLSWNLAGTVYVGKDFASLLYGVGDSNYGPNLANGPTLGDAPVLNAAGNELKVIHGTSWGIGYTHLWTPTVNSSLFVLGANYSKDTDTGMTGAKFHQWLQYGVNTLVNLTTTTRFGAEYIYGKATTFDDNTLTNADGTKTNKITESKLRLQLRYLFN
jgi:hypothetical protein